MFWRDEAYSVNVLESGEDEILQVLSLVVRRNDVRQALPGVARAFDHFDFIVQVASFL